jgi:SAM-dependent methyltransferase
MNPTIKRNVEEFDHDVIDNGGYRYTSNAPYSSMVSNKRITDETEKIITAISGIKTVIDVGCGDGTYTDELKKRMPGISFYGFDPAQAAIKSAAERYPACEFLTGDILDPMTFPKKKFDIAIIRGVIHHLPTQSLAVKNASLLSDRILIIEPNGNNPILKWIEKNSEYHIKHEEQSFTSDFLSKICDENGMLVKRISFIGFVPFFFPSFFARIIYFFQPLLEKIPWLPKYFGAQTVILSEKK